MKPNRKTVVKWSGMSWRDKIKLKKEERKAWRNFQTSFPCAPYTPAPQFDQRGRRMDRFGINPRQFCRNFLTGQHL
jgi:hypothetical protein